MNHGGPSGSRARRSSSGLTDRRGSASTRAIGSHAEDIAADYFTACGLVVLARNLRVGRIEVDLVVRDGPVVALVEVRTRGAASWVRSLDSIDARKRARIRSAGKQLWRERFCRDGSIERMRFDAVSVTFDERGEARVEHIKAAW
jgi:putative endonuclease